MSQILRGVKKHKRMIINPIIMRLSVKKGKNIANPELYSHKARDASYFAIEIIKYNR